MNAKKTIKKILALGAGVTMVGATIMGAMAYDLANYPAPFITNGVMNGKIVVGAKAATSDVMGAIDIAASLQSMAVSKKAVEIPGAAGEVNLQGDTFKIESASSKLALRENVSEVVDTVTDSDLAALKGGEITTSEGTTTYNQYLRFKELDTTTGNNSLQDFAVNYIDNNENVISDYLVIPNTDKPFFEWEMQFGQGLESKLDSDGRLRDMEDETLNIFGTDYSIVTAKYTDTTSALKMTLMGGSAPATLHEGETKTFTIDGTDYEVTLVFVSDPSNSNSAPEAKLMVNGETTKSLYEGDTDTLSNGMQIGVRDILVNGRDGVASFYLGADKLVFYDSNTTDNEYSTGSAVEINNQNIVGGNLKMTTSYTNDVVTITDIKYQLEMDAIGGDAYIPVHNGIRSILRYPEATLSPDFDIRYEGLTQPTREDVAITSNGDDQYRLKFTNIDKESYTIPFVSNRDGIFQFGDDKDNLVFLEANSSSTYNIDMNDYFIVTNSPWDDRSVTEVLQYNDIDVSNNVLYFTDESSGAQIEVSYTPSTSTGTGNLVVGGHTFVVNVNNTNSTSGKHMIGVDQNANGHYGDQVGVTVLGGGKLNLLTGFYNDHGNVTALTGTNDLSDVIGHGKKINDASLNWTNLKAGRFGMNITTLEKNFDTPISDEVLKWRILTADSSPYVSLEHSATDFSGPQANKDNIYSDYRFTTNTDDSTNYYGMTDYGVLVDKYVPTGSNPVTLTLSYPEDQVFGQVFVTAGEVNSNNESSGVTTEVVNPIAVGFAVQDSDVSDLSSDNLIVVGGPCANTVAAQLMGNNADCAAGFSAGKALIKSFENGDKVAILVAGYEAQDTLGASYVLANYGDYANFKGDEVEVVVPDLSNLVVQAVTAAPSTPATPAVDNTTAGNTTQ